MLKRENLLVIQKVIFMYKEVKKLCTVMKRLELTSLILYLFSLSYVTVKWEQVSEMFEYNFIAVE